MCESDVITCFNLLGPLVNCILSILTLLLVIATFFSAIAAFKAAKKTHKNTQAQVIQSLLNEYSSEEMTLSINILRRLHTAYGKVKYPQEFDRLRIRYLEDKATSEEQEQYLTWDKSRRRVAHYFEKICTLDHNDLLERQYIDAVANKEQILLYEKLIKPLVHKINKESKLECYDRLKKYHQDKKPS